MICEDYPRDPPIEARRIPNSYNAATSVRSRTLTKEEAVHARKYAGGECWIKVTFDSEQAANRAISNSPHQISGYWVYASLYTGEKPTVDKPLLERDYSREQNSKKRKQRASQTLGSSFASNNNFNFRGNATFPRSFTSPTDNNNDQQPLPLFSSQSPSTATSATATATDYPDLSPHFPQTLSPPTPEPQQPRYRDPDYFTHFPTVRRNSIRPEHEAFLPQPSWLQETIRSLIAAGWMPANIIGDDAPPTLENGQFDWARASYYWRFFYWLDCILRTDFCGLKDE